MRLRRLSPEQWVTIALVAAMFAYTAYFSWVSIIQAGVVDAYSDDLGHAWQTVWNVAHGYGFTMTHVPSFQTGSRLSIHADYLLIMLAPVAWIWQSYQVLVLVQAAAVAAGAWWIWKIAWRRIGYRPVAIVLAGAYLMYGPLQFPVIWQFHAVTVAVAFMLAMVEAIVYRRRVWIVWLWFGLALITKEQVGVVAGSLALIEWWRAGHRRMGWWAAVIGTVYSLVHFAIIIPAFRPAGDPHLVWKFYYGTEGSQTLTELLARVQPRILWSKLVTALHGENIVYFVTPLLGLPLFSWYFWLGIFWLLPHWLADDLTVNSLYAQNHVLAIPFIFLGIIDVLAKLRARFHHAPRAWIWPSLSFGLVFSIVVGSVIMSPFPWSLKYIHFHAMKDAELRQLTAVERTIPHTATVSYSFGLAPIFRSRPHVYVLPGGVTHSDYVVVYETLGRNGHRSNGADYRFYRSYLDTSAAFEPIYTSDRAAVYHRLSDHTSEPLPPAYRDPVTSPRQ